PYPAWDGIRLRCIVFDGQGICLVNTASRPARAGYDRDCASKVAERSVRIRGPKESKLLKLKKLQILGFKSFCDRTELKFHGDGVAAIVGPNGCGKSNIADAISWVLGEQSAKTLRGSRMEDVIFAGTRERNPTGMAEVSLTLLDPEVYNGPDASEPTEIDIQDDMPESAEHWDETELRAKAAEETEHMVEEA